MAEEPAIATGKSQPVDRRPPNACARLGAMPASGGRCALCRPAFGAKAEGPTVNAGDRHAEDACRSVRLSRRARHRRLDGRASAALHRRRFAGAARRNRAAATPRTCSSRTRRTISSWSPSEEDAVVDLKQIHQLIGAASRVSFGKPEALMEHLGVTPGAVTAFGADQRYGQRRCRFVIDEALMRHDVINAPSADQRGDHLDCGCRPAALRAGDGPRTACLESIALIATCWPAGLELR